MSDAKVYQFGEAGSSSLNALLPFLQQRGIDPSYIAGLMNNGNNGGFFGNNAWEGIIALIVVAAIFGNNNGGGIFGGGNNANSAEREMLMSAIQRNGTDLSQLAQSIGCSNARVVDAIGEVSTQICNFAGQNGLSFQQVINSIQSGDASLASQICSCCCDIKQAISESNFLTERGFCNTNQILSRGFSDIGYATQQQTCNIEKAIAASTAEIMAGQRAAEMREMQDKIDKLREMNSQQAVILNNAQQTSQFAAMLAPIQADLAELKCNQVPVKKIACPEQYVPLNTSINAAYSIVPTCGYGIGFGTGYNLGTSWNSGCCSGNSLWG